MRIGFFGGSFDPVHLGHLILAEQCLEFAKLDQVWFVPTATSPLKTDGSTASDRQRMEMLEFALAGHSQFLLSDTEIKRGGVSYTVDTLSQIHQESPDDELFLLIGGDSLQNFDAWRNPEKICQLATPLVVARPGADPVDLSRLAPYVDDERMKEVERYAFESRLIDISSTEIRTRIGAGQSVRYLTPRAVEMYIESKSLYQPEE
jgi:nicotinate-nucleotide adenylyltransferase